ncbi:colicin V biosynthesis protein [Dyella flagellata]|uniref:Colicin V biosynthesis protein n=2 Tax=Dyella flagellata TaxID=1867833 RepID=A0ABQ5XDJ1_9GAMM|nr:colicin V biosynthesis protein [Dyella flagellata]
MKEGIAGAGPHPISRLRFGWGRHMPIILQTEATECGLASLAMVASYYGYETDLAHLRSRFSISLKGAKLARLIEIASSLGLQARPVRLELEELDRLQVPCILHWNLNHFVVLKRVTAKKVVLVDPVIGERTLSIGEVSEHFTGVALELTPSATFKRVSAAPPFSFKDLTGRIVGLKGALSQIFGLALVLELFALLSPQFTQFILDQVLADGDHDLLTLLGVGFGLLILVQVAVTALRSWSVTCLGTKLNLAWTTNVFGHLMKLPEDYFQKRHLGDVVSRFGSVGAIQQTLTTRFVEVILDGLMAIATLAMILIYSPPLAVLTLGAFALYGVLRFWSYRTFREANMGSIVAAAKQQSQLLESIRGVQTIRLYNRGVDQTARYANKTTETLNRSVAIQRLNLLFSSLNALLFGMQRIAILWWGAYMALQGRLSAGMLMAFVAYSDQFTSRAAGLIDYGVELRMLRLQGERLADIVLTAPEKHVDSSYRGPAPEPSIELRRVSFRYAEGEAWVVKDYDLVIAAGESIAITGPSGCGKTTLAKLVLGLLEPEEGAIFIGGVDMKRLGKKAFREMAGAVMQEGQLFAGSIADNISFFDTEASQDRIERAARLAAIHTDVVGMPMGYDSLVGDMGSSLSGGQKQRLLLARALYREPKILVLDEATSHLDVGLEHLVNDAVKQMAMTRIVIAHRPETIASADRVIDFTANGTRERSRVAMAWDGATSSRDGVRTLGHGKAETGTAC